MLWLAQAGIHPTNLINLDSEPETLELARRTVYGQVLVDCVGAGICCC